MTWVLIWLGISIGLLLIELSTKKLNFNYFIFSSVLTLATTKFFKSFIIQFLIFIIVGFILTVYNKKIIKFIEKIYKKDMIGRTGQVVKAIKKGEVGIIKINKLKYKAVSSSEIKENSMVKIVDVSEFILKVEKTK